jgi:aminopeptidase
MFINNFICVILNEKEIDRMDDKYIELLINKCTNVKEVPVLFISFNKEIRNFIDKLVDYVKKLGINDIYLEEVDQYLIHDLLKSMSYEEMDASPYFNKSIWDEYAKKGASFLMLETEIPHLMDDIDPKKIGYMGKLKRSTKPLYRKLQEECKIPWCIAAYPGEEWAREIFKNDNDAYDKLKNYIFNMCMVDRDNPSDEWEKLLEKNTKIMKKLNSLNLEKLHYKNSLGTDLVIYLPKNYRYASTKDNNVIVNMPSYEVFTSPIYDKTEGIVYSAKSLSYNGSKIDDFWIKFKDGKVIDMDAKVGRDVLEEIINTDEYSCYLGEAALVEKDSPIARLNINFETTLIDENASCHLALGAGFAECLDKGLTMSKEELKSNGINDSKQHVDFMIGTDDLCILGTTYDKREIKIFENGKFSSDILG